MLETISVAKPKLLKTLKENKAKHVGEYDDAVAVYREKAEKALRKQAIAIRDGVTLAQHVDNLPIPKSFEKEYDHAIAMVEWETRPEIELDESSFKSFILDEWHWHGQFVGSTAAYNSIR